VIQTSLQNSLATRLLEGSISDGETVNVSAAEGGLVINGIKAKAA
jgi:ATP-dependent Clp protease ATP-binding subunit ClpB